MSQTPAKKLEGKAEKCKFMSVLCSDPFFSKFLSFRFFAAAGSGADKPKADSTVKTSAKSVQYYERVKDDSKPVLSDNVNLAPETVVFGSIRWSCSVRLWLCCECSIRLWLSVSAHEHVFVNNVFKSCSVLTHTRLQTHAQRTNHNHAPMTLSSCWMSVTVRE